MKESQTSTLIAPSGCLACGNPLRVLKKNEKGTFAICGECELYQMKNADVPDQEELYDDYHHNKAFRDQYDETLQSDQQALIQKIHWIRPKLTKNEFHQLKFLDVGCGAANFVNAAAKLGMQAHGIDIDKTNVQWAQDNKLNVLHGDIRDGQFQDDFFDVIQIKQVLEHVQEPVTFLEEVKRILSPQGFVCIDVPNQHGIIPQLRILFRLDRDHGFLQPPRHSIAFTRKSLRTIVTKVGLHVLKTPTFSPGDKTFYPLLRQPLLNRFVFKTSSLIGLGSDLAIFANKAI